MSYRAQSLRGLIGTPFLIDFWALNTILQAEAVIETFKLQKFEKSKLFFA
jgi:hypothetical protein